MSWIRPKSDEPQTETLTAFAEPNYNRDMKSPDPAPVQARSTSGSAKIGQSIQIEGTLTGNEDLTIEGRVHGKIDLRGHSLIIGTNGKIDAGLSAKQVIVQGEVKGNISAEDKIQITSSGSVAGDLRAPRIALDDGARFAGSVDMGAEKAAPKAEAAKPEHANVRR